MIKKLKIALLVIFIIYKHSFAFYAEEDDMLEEFICENDCVVINSENDIKDTFNTQVQNKININNNNITFNNIFHNDIDGVISGNNNHFNANFINHGIVEGSDNIFENVENGSMFYGYNHKINGSIINDGSFFGDNFFIGGSFVNTYYGLYDSFYTTFGNEINDGNFVISNSGLFYGFENVFNYDFYNKADGTILGENHTFNKQFINEQDGVLVGSNHIFNENVNNDGEIYSNAHDELSGFIFKKNVTNNGYIQGSYSKFKGDTINNGNIFGTKNTFLNIQNNGNIYVDDIFVNGNVENGKHLLDNGDLHNISLFSIDDTPTIYSNNSTFDGTIHNCGMLLGSNLKFNNTISNDGDGWIVGDNLIFNGSVTNGEFGDIIGEHYDFNAQLKNYGAVDVANGQFFDIQNFGEINAIAYDFKGVVSNSGNLRIAHSNIYADIADESDLKSSTLRISSSKVNANINNIDKVFLRSSLVKNHGTINSNHLNIRNSLIRSKLIKSGNLKIEDSLIYGKIQTSILEATNTSFILHADRFKPLHKGFGGSIVVFDDISGGNNTLKINNLNTQELDKHFIPLLVARSINGIDENYFQVTTTKNLSVFGLDKKYYKFKKIGDFYVAGIGNDENITQEKLSLAIEKLQSPQDIQDTSADDLISLINGENSNEWNENIYDYDKLFYIGPDEKNLKENMSLMQNQINTFYVLQNSVFKRLGDIKNYKKDGIWTRYYNGKISYEDTPTKYNSKSIGFDKYDNHAKLDSYLGIFVYDLHSSAQNYNSQSYGFGGYGSLFFNNGLFLDATLRYTTHNDISVSELFGKINNNYYSILTSLEIGYEHNFLNGFYIKPDIEMFYLYHPEISKKINKTNFIINKTNNLSLKLGFDLGYNIDQKFMIGIGSGLYFDVLKESSYGIYDGYAMYSKNINKDKIFKTNILGSYHFNKDLMLNFSLERSFASDFKLNYEANFNIRYHFN